MDDFDYMGFDDEEPKQTEDYIGSATTPVDESKIKKYLFDEAEEAYEEELERQRRIAAQEYMGDALDSIGEQPKDDYIGDAVYPSDDSQSMEYMPGEYQSEEHGRGYGM